MKYFYLSLLTLLISCDSNESHKRSVDFYDYLTDKVWLTENKAQYYFSSDNDTEYMWNAVDRSGDSTYYPFVRAKGTPSKNPYPASYSSYMEGWEEWNYFKIEKNRLILQDPDDIDGMDLTTFELEIGQDTTIGVLNYQTIKVINKFGTRTWMTRENSE